MRSGSASNAFCSPARNIGAGPKVREAGLSRSQPAVAWVLQNDNVSAAMIGASRPEQVTDNAGASGVRLDEAT